MNATRSGFDNDATDAAILEAARNAGLDGVVTTDSSASQWDGRK
jgi:hypothetical protein